MSTVYLVDAVAVAVATSLFEYDSYPAMFTPCCSDLPIEQHGTTIITLSFQQNHIILFWPDLSSLLCGP